MLEQQFLAQYPLRKMSSQDNIALLAWQKVKQVQTGLALAARTTTTQTATISAEIYRGIAAFHYVSVAGTGNLTFRFQVRPVGGSWVNLYSATAVTTTGYNCYALYPGIGNASSLFFGINHVLFAREVRLEVTHSDASSWTYQLDYWLIP